MSTETELSVLLDELRAQAEEWKTHAVARYDVARRFAEPQASCERRVGDAFKGCGERLDALVRQTEHRVMTAQSGR